MIGLVRAEFGLTALAGTGLSFEGYFRRSLFYGGRHWVAINKFLETNDLSHLEAFVGLELRDSQGRFHPFEGRPNVLRSR
jgi:hypothetical protein